MRRLQSRNGITEALSQQHTAISTQAERGALASGTRSWSTAEVDPALPEARSGLVAAVVAFAAAVATLSATARAS